MSMSPQVRSSIKHVVNDCIGHWQHVAKFSVGNSLALSCSINPKGDLWAYSLVGTRTEVMDIGPVKHFTIYDGTDAHNLFDRMVVALDPPKHDPYGYTRIGNTYSVFKKELEIFRVTEEREAKAAVQALKDALKETP